MTKKSNCKDHDKKCQKKKDCKKCNEELYCKHVPGGKREKRCLPFNPKELAFAYPPGR